LDLVISRNPQVSNLYREGNSSFPSVSLLSSGG
jgi:hypothetical protein